MKGFIYVACNGLETNAALRSWVEHGVRHAASRPAKASSRKQLPANQLQLTAPRGAVSGSMAVQGGTWDAFFWVRDVRALHAELCANGVAIAYGPIVQDEYQMEEFAVRDPNGYVLGFGQPVTPR